METGRADKDERDRLAERRDDEADRREADADQRERQTDARERVLDRWEQEIAARAKTLDLFDELAEEALDRGRLRRVHEHEQRRDAAEARRDAAIERDIRRADQTDPAPPPDGPAHGTAPTSLARLTSALQANPPLDQLLHLMLAVAVEAVHRCAAATVTLMSQGRLHPAASTASWAAELDAVQLELDSGPLPTAAEGGLVVTADLGGDERWPRLAALPGTNAERSVISVGLVVGGAGTGALTLYGDVGGRFGEQAVRIGDLLGAHAAATLARRFERLTYEAQAEAWQHALASRDVIGQAKGILMAQRSTSADEAFHLLRETSQRLNVKLRIVAEQVVTDRHLPET